MSLICVRLYDNAELAEEGDFQSLVQVFRSIYGAGAFL